MQSFYRLGVAVIFAFSAVIQSVYSDTATPSKRIDQLVFAKLDELGIPRSDDCSDEVFLRRAYLDVIGTLPQAQEVRRFLDVEALDRNKLIDDLLARDEFADYWAMKWCDLLRVKAEFPSNLWPNAVQAYHRWIRTALANNMPYDEFARTLLTSNGSNFRVAPVNFYRAVPKREAEEIAQIVALTFMGMRTDGWGLEKRQGMAAFFGNVGYKKTAEWKEEIIFFDPTKTFLNEETQKSITPVLPNGVDVVIAAGQDPRLLFTDWLVESKIFASCMVKCSFAGT